jgi:hypothetical protein
VTDSDAPFRNLQQNLGEEGVAGAVSGLIARKRAEVYVPEIDPEVQYDLIQQPTLYGAYSMRAAFL